MGSRAPVRLARSVRVSVPAARRACHRPGRGAGGRQHLPPRGSAGWRPVPDTRAHRTATRHGRRPDLRAQRRSGRGAVGRRATSLQHRGVGRPARAAVGAAAQRARRDRAGGRHHRPRRPAPPRRPDRRRRPDRGRDLESVRRGARPLPGGGRRRPGRRSADRGADRPGPRPGRRAGPGGAFDAVEGAGPAQPDRGQRPCGRRRPAGRSERARRLARLPGSLDLGCLQRRGRLPQQPGRPDRPPAHGAGPRQRPADRRLPLRRPGGAVPGHRGRPAALRRRHPHLAGFGARRSIRRPRAIRTASRSRPWPPSSAAAWPSAGR